jgi:hypothetical protein
MQITVHVAQIALLNFCNYFGHITLYFQAPPDLGNWELNLWQKMTFINDQTSNYHQGFTKG